MDYSYFLVQFKVFLRSLRNLISSSGKNHSNYRLLVTREIYNEEKHKFKVFIDPNTREPPEYFYEFRLVSMSPAVAFQDLKTTHSILLTSGTLSPMDTFASELGTKFTQRLGTFRFKGHRNF